MNHSVVLANNVNCISCHSDLIHGAGEVTRRDCQNCHDQERYLKDLDHPTTQVVEDYHRVHAAAQRARCNDCHRLIEHKLLPMTDIHEAVSLLSPVRQDCQNCHPSHHREQVEMLLGQGGFVQGITSLPNPMTGSRANCRACHTARGADPKDEAVITGTLESCRGCHGQEYVKLFTQWKEGIAARLKEAQDLLASTEQRLAAAGWSGVLPASQPAPERPGVSPASRPVGTGAQPINADLREAIRLVDRARANIHLVATANGIHNKNYAMALLDQAIQDLDEAGRRLGK
jgi:nitrate/TMAO reductase-like tetraheme cytochrome c subunit